jgi:polyisoprenoid-binding protein YceI
MNRSATLALSLAVVLAWGCDNNPGKDKPKATVASATPTTAAAPAPGAVRWPISQENSKIEYVGAKVTLKHTGGFEKFSGSVQMPGNNIEAATLQLVIEMDSITSDSEKLTVHLKSKEFFEVEKHPKATFVSSAIKRAAGDGKYDVTGNLTMKGVTKAVTFPATIQVTDDALDAKAEFAINRKDWGIVYPGMPDDLIKDEVALKLTVRSTRPRS